MTVKRHCDLCHIAAEPIQRCAFGEDGVDLFLHPACQDALLEMSRDEQDQALAKAAAYNRKVLGTSWQTP
jgi:hypothetical protein